MFIGIVNIDKSKRLWIVILIAIIIAFLLITISSIYIYLKKDKKTSAVELFNLDNYYAEYELTIFSNKNQNSYNIREWYLKQNDNESFRFDFKNDLDEVVTYVLTKSSLNITSDKQSSSYNIDSYNINKKNLLSFATFIQLYLNCLDNKYKGISIENKNIDNAKHYIIHIDSKMIEKDNEFYKEYEDIISNRYNISKIELIVNDNIPIEYYVIDNNNKVLIGIKYTKFDIKNKFDEKIFANFNK